MATLRVPEVVPSPTQDCERLRKAFQGEENGNPDTEICNCISHFITMGLGGCLLLGWGTDEKAVIKVLAQRNATQRKLIRDTYFQLYNQSLIDSLRSELSGDFGKAVVLWTYDPPERDARLGNEALNSKKKGINELQVIVEIACASSPHHLVAVRQAYCSLFDCSIEEDIISNVPVSVRQILLGLVSSYRFDGEVVDLAVANYEASKLREAIESKQLDQDFVVWVLATRNIFQLKATFDCYKQNYGNSVDKDIKSCGKGILESVLTVVAWCIDSPEKHFAEVIRASIAGLGTDEDSLTRAIVARAEIDMMKIRGEYYNANKSSLDNAVKGDTSGDYKDFLMTLLGAKI